ncbi:MAG: type II secretion system F family protein [Kiritimatiellae bacterium]|nr:type II secretion system F family protein [Kiritimatiellia bacterium]
MDIIIIISLGVLWAAFAAGITWHLAQTAFAITYVTLADGRRQERRLPTLFRVLLPLTPALTPFFRRPYFRRAREQTLVNLVSSGFDDVISPEEFMALRVLTPLVVVPVLSIPVISAFALLQGHAGSGSSTRIAALFGALLLTMLLYPTWWLQQAVALRHRLILKALPFVIDLLTLSVEAGLDFMTAIKNIVDRRPPDPIAEELSRVLFEIQLGKTRREALTRLAERVHQLDIQSLVMALVQADELGVSIGATLRIQSDQIRTKRFMRAEKLANEAPVKMLFPLVACIFPTVFLIMLGPIILQMLKYGF